jgi:hypothetical protein
MPQIHRVSALGHNALTSKGLHKATKLAKEMLAASVKLLKLLMEYTKIVIAIWWNSWSFFRKMLG